MIEDVVPAIAAALSAQGSELVAAGSRSALKSLFDMVRERLGKDAEQADALDAAINDPEDLNNVEDLALHIRSVMLQDPDFAQRILVGWRAVAASGSAEGDAVVNNFSGQAERVVQARTIRGGIKF